MPKGDNPNSRANLKRLSSREARENGKKGGRKRVENIQLYASLTEALRDQCTPEVIEDIAKMLIKRAKAGNLKAYELVRDQLGEKPNTKVSMTPVEVRVEFEEAVCDLKEELRKRQESNK